MADTPAAHRLAARALALRDGMADPAALVRAHDLFLDFLGVAVGGASEPSSRILRRGLARLDDGAGHATVLGAAERFSVPAAALANGAAAHALEMDDTHQGGSIHLGASVFPAALAAAEQRGLGGDAVLRAAIAGYEVGARLAMALDPAAHYRRGFHPTGTCGAFAAATAAGLLYDLDVAQLTAALGIAGSQAAGSMEFLADGSWTKRFHPGWAAHSGLHAAALAAAGFTGPATILDGRFGTLAGYSDAPRADALLADGPPEILRTSLKPHACCRYMQGPIDATLTLRGAGMIDPDAVTRVEVGMLAAGWAIVCDPPEQKRRPASVVDAQFSLPFGIAVALRTGSAAPDDFAPERWNDPHVQRLMDVVVAVRDPALDDHFPRAWPAWVRITLGDGRQLTEHVLHPTGDPERFLTRPEIVAKMRRLAGRTLSTRAVDELVREADSMATARQLQPLLAATRAPAT